MIVHSSFVQGERDFQAQIIDLAHLQGWRIYHTRDSRRSEPGFPDLVLVRGRCCIFAEVKTESGKVTSEQREWLDALSGVHEHSTIIWRPGDWPDIERTLRRDA